EARLASRIRNPHVVPTLDVIAEDGELLLVMEYIEGETVSELMRWAGARGQSLPMDKVAGIVCGALHGLHAAHDAKDEEGAPLDIVHRDVSPQNIMLGRDGVARVLDFGVAKAAEQMHSTAEGKIKGKLRYMSPEQITGQPIDRRTDVFAAGVVCWEMLTGKRLIGATGGAASALQQILNEEFPPPSSARPEIPRSLDRVVMRALSKDRRARHATAREFALELEGVLGVASPHELGAWLEGLAGESLRQRAGVLGSIERWRDGASGSGELSRSDLARITPVPNVLRTDAATQMNTASTLDVQAARSSRKLPVALGVLGVGALALAFSLGRLQAEDTPPASSPVAAAAPVAAAPVAAPAPAAAAAAPTAAPSPAAPSPNAPLPAAPLPATPTPAASETPTATSKPTPTASTPTATKVAPKASTSTAKSSPCANPTFVDASGIRRFKPQCM
ncbi:MAG TPA: serine/threonine-protein kinase, partial [Polyangiaceae bacterium]|nr:serine/threonine-protein kinase [Polyangiaceae bacterium]